MSIFEAVKEIQNAENIAAACAEPTQERYKYICPFCGSGTRTHRTAALSLNPRTGLFKCFACGFFGDAITLLQEAKNLSKADAINAAKDRLWYVEETGKKQFPGRRPTVGRADARQAQLQQSIRTAEKGRQIIWACRKAAAADAEFKAYLSKRGITPEAACRFRLGLHTQRLKDGSTGKYLLIPYNDTFFTRRLISAAADAEAPKYIKDRGSAPLLFYATATGQDIDPDAVLFVTEGEIDAIILEQAGFQAVGLGSATNTGNLLKALPSGFRGEIKICLDADEKGRAAAAALSEQLSNQGIKHSKALLPTDFKDVGEIAERASAKNADPVIEVRRAFVYDI